LALLLCLVACGLALTILAPTGKGQTLKNGVYYTNKTTFRIPFDVDDDERRYQEVNLYVSEDQGLTWQKYDSVKPERHGFNYRAERDGLYWFTVQTVDTRGRLNPATMQNPEVQLKVCLDRQEPIIRLTPAQARDGMVGVEWDIREPNLDLQSLALEYRTATGTDWMTLPIEPAATGQRYWNAGANGSLSVRLRARDLAKNEGEGKITLLPGGQYVQATGNPGDPDSARSGGRPGPEKRWVNSKRISLNYEIKDKGPSGVEAVELWFTRDRKTWEKYNEQTNPTPPYVFEVHDEGVYGFSLVVRNGVGLGESPPRSGDAPQVWVEVDLTKPIVHWVQTEVGRGPDTGKLLITWKATDANLGREPITLSYAENQEGNWTQIISNLENTGKYQWQKGPGPPHRFWVRVEATDKAGNVGSAISSKQILFDLAQPTSVITGVDSVRAETTAKKQ
jgi:hypothetical protein